MNRYLIELLGTTLFSFSIFATGNYLIIGATLAIVILMSRGIGAFNPAISIALFYANKLSVNDLIPSIIAQIIGGLAGFEIVNRFLKR